MRCADLVSILTAGHLDYLAGEGGETGVYVCGFVPPSDYPKDQKDFGFEKV